MIEARQSQSSIYEFGGFRLDVGRRQLRSCEDQPADLTVKVFDILLYLVEHHGELVEKAALMQAVWPNVVVEENNLNQNISVLRRVLGERAGEHRFIMTVPGRGFRFVAPVTLSASKSTAAALPARPLAMASSVPRIAVMPFENLSPDPANAFFADGLHDEILATLAQRAPGLQVISRTTMMRYRANPAPLPRIAAELNANYVMEGTVRREGDQVRVTLQLIDARDDRHLWAQSYNRTLKSALTLQSEVANDVASRLAARFLGDTAVPPTNDPEAYDLYLRARVKGPLVTPLSPREQYDEVIALLDRAIACDPNYAAAYAQRVGFCGAMFSFNYDTSEEFLERIRADIATAKRLAPADPFVLGSEASHLGWIENDLPRALATFQAAGAAGLSDPMLLSSYAMVMERLGRNAEALALFERADALDPANPFIIATGAFALSTLQRVAEAMAVIDRGIALYPERGFLRLVRAQIVFVITGRDADMRRELDLATRQLPLPGLLDLNFRVMLNARAYDDLERMLDAIPDREVRAVPGPGGGGMFLGVGQRPIAQFRGWLALLRGAPSAAARHGTEVLEFVARQKRSPRNSWFLHWLCADGYTFLGQHDRAIAAARAAMEARPSSGDTFGFFVTLCAARNLAWCGAASEACALLESIFAAGQTRFLAFIPRDPALTTSLATEQRFHALIARFEAHTKANDIA